MELSQDAQQTIIATARKAGEAIMQHYKEGYDVSEKEDESPVTSADIAAHHIIVDVLKELTPEVIIISEENQQHDAVATGETFWLVDPLDGTKSFIKGTGEFTVNIALICESKPVYGVVYMPAQEVMYYTDGGKAFKQGKGEGAVQIQARQEPEAGAVVVASQSHRTAETDAFINTLPKVDHLVSAASSLKFCLIAEGTADVYPRFGRTMEWDTAAGHAVVLASGGTVTREDNTPLAYGKSEFENPYFIVRGR